MEMEEPEPPMPNDVSITSDTTRVDVKLRPPGVNGPRVELVLRLAITECHTWRGIGGRTERCRPPRWLCRNTWLALDDGEPDYYQRSAGDDDDCRRLIRGAIEHSLRRQEAYRCLSPAYWDQAAPVGIERAIAGAVAVAPLRGDVTFEANVDISVAFKFTYSEPKALLLACDVIGGGGLTGRRSGNGGSCPICFEEMSRDADDEVTDLPGCTHSFHRRCIAVWFHKASTCPVCRHDQLEYLPQDYWDLHDAMDPDNDMLPDYLRW